MVKENPTIHKVEIGNICNGIPIPLALLSFTFYASPLKRNFLLLELKEFRCKWKQFPPYELLGFSSPPIVKAFFSQKNVLEEVI